MEIFNSTGKNIANSGVILVTKSIGSLVVSSSLDVEALTTEKIRVEVERLDGNFEITKGLMFLKDFILMTTFNADAVTADATYKTTAHCEICEHGSIILKEHDVIKVELTGLKSAETYVLNGIEEPVQSIHILSFENKSMSADDRSKVFMTHGNDLALIDNDSNIEEVAYRYDNGTVVKYTLHELRVLSRSIDPVGYIRQDGTVKSAFAAKIQLPLKHVNEIEVRKTQGSIVNLLVRNEI
jgi:hypothetical protein